MIVKANQVPDICDEGKAGDYEFVYELGTEKICGMDFICPCGCGNEGYLSFDIHEDKKFPSWKWNGDEGKPTLTPSILKTSGCKWHGYLTEGEFREC